MSMTDYNALKAEVRSKTDLVSLIGQDIAITQCGSVFKGKSPKHRDSDPSFVVWPQTQTWMDFAGGGRIGGDCFAYVMYRDGVDFMQSLRMLASTSNIALPTAPLSREELQALHDRRRIEEILTEAARYYHTQLPPQIRQDWLQFHYGFTDKTIDSLQLGWANGGLLGHLQATLNTSDEELLQTGLIRRDPATHKLREFFFRRIVFPYWKRGHVAYFIARSIDSSSEKNIPKYIKLPTHSAAHPEISPNIANNHFYNEDCNINGADLLITEGVTDCISAIQCGVSCISPVTVRFRQGDIPKLIQLSKRAKRIIICNDNEENGAGEAGAMETALALHENNLSVYIATIPRPLDVSKIDINTLVRTQGPGALSGVIATAKRFPHYLINKIPPSIETVELADALAPAIRAVARLPIGERETYINLISKRFNMRKSVVGTWIKETAGKHASHVLNTSNFSDNAGHQIVDDVFKSDHPELLSPSLIVPHPYMITPTALVMRKRSGDSGDDEQLARIAFSPVLITARIKQADSGSTKLRVAWKRDGVWITRVFGRNALMQATEITKLADQDFPVASENAKQLSNYLHHFEAVNMDYLPVEYVSPQFGWQQKAGESSFLCGNAAVAPHDSIASPIRFSGDDQGDARLARSYEANGSFEEWRDAVSFLRHHPRALIAFYAAFVPPLLDILETPNFVVDLANRTSTGKTSSLYAAASVWCNPADIPSWDTTLVGLERMACVLNHMPIVLDDTKRARKTQDVAKLVYMVANGQGRVRGSLRGMAAIRTWRTVLISSGEAPITTYTQDGGTRGRTLSVQGLPFSGVDNSLGMQIAAFRNTLQRHFGHAGPKFIEYILANSHQHEDWRAAFRRRVERLSATQPDGSANRLAEHAAAIEQAAAIAHDALMLPWACGDFLAAIWPAMAREAVDAPGEERALHDVMSWAYSKQESFIGRHNENSFTGEARVPSEGWLGVWDSKADWQQLAFHPPKLRTYLQSLGYHADSILAGWRERGWLDCDHDRSRNTKIVTLGAGQDRARVRMVVIKRESIELVAM